MDRRVVSSWLLAVLALLLCVPSAVALSRVDDGVARTRTTVDGVPVTVLAPSPPPAARLPGVVVAHGFAGSAQLMDGIGLALARAGFVVALLDFTGHGENPAALPLTGSTPAAEVLAADLDAVVQWMGRRGDVAPGGIGLVGHSMGAGAVVRYAVADARDGRGRVAATVALSLPSADDVPAGAPAVPRNLLLQWGAAEQPRFGEAAMAALRAGYPGADAGTTYGRVADGTARRAVEVPGVEHISILFHPTMLAETQDWLRAAVPAAAVLAAAASAASAAPEPSPSDGRLAWVGVWYLGAAIGFVPLARVAFGGVRRRPVPAAAVAGTDGAPLPAGRALALLAVAAIAASLAAWALGAVAGLVPLAVGGWLTIWFTGAGVAATALLTVVRRRRIAGEGHLASHRATKASLDVDRDAAPPIVEPSDVFPWRVLVATTAMTAYAVLALGLVARRTWTAFAVVGARGWVLLLVMLAFLAYFWAEERIVARPSRSGRGAMAAASRVIAVVVIFGSVALLGAPAFLTLLLPLMVVLFVLLGFYAVVVSGLTGRRWAPAVVQAVPLAFLVATTFPLIG